MSTRPASPGTRGALAVLAAALALTVIYLVTRPSAPAGTDDAFNWASKLVAWRPIAAAPAEAEKGSRRILYDFNAAWCGPCHELDDEVFKNPEYARFINEHFVAVSVVDRQSEDGRNPAGVSELQRRYRISAFPTLILAAPDGSVIARMEGYSGEAATMRFLGRT